MTSFALCYHVLLIACAPACAVSRFTTFPGHVRHGKDHKAKFQRSASEVGLDIGAIGPQRLPGSAAEVGSAPSTASLMSFTLETRNDLSAQFVHSVGLGDLTLADSMDMFSINGSTQFYAFGVCFAALVGTVTLIYSSRGFFACACIISYISALSLMSALIRRIYTVYSFKYPQFVTATHFFSTSVVGFTLLLHRYSTKGIPIVVPSVGAFAYGIIPVGLANALSIGFSNRGLMYSNAHFYEMMSSQSLLVTAVVGAAMSRPLNSKLLPALFMMTVGLLYLAHGEVHFSAIGAVCIFIGVLMRATKVQIQGLLMGGTSSMQQLDPIELVAWSSANCFLIMAVWSLAAEGQGPYEKISDAQTLRAVMISAVAACLLNVTGMFVLKELGPVAQQCVGQLKGAVACVVAVNFLGEVVTRQQVVGYSIVISAIMWYNNVDKALKNAAQAEKEKAKPPAGKDP